MDVWDTHVAKNLSGAIVTVIMTYNCHMPKIYVLLDNIRSAYNVGSVFRTCDSAGVDKLILTGYCALPPNPKLNKTALGSIENIDWEHQCDAETAAIFFKKQGFQIICFETCKDACSLYQHHFTKDACLVFGNEETGINPKVIGAADAVLKIPQFGIKESLNIASAAAIGIYEFRRQTVQ